MKSHPNEFKTCQNHGAVNQPDMFFPCQDFIEFLLTSFEEAAPTATWTLTNGALLKSLSVAIAMAASMVTLGARAFQKCISLPDAQCIAYSPTKLGRFWGVFM